MGPAPATSLPGALRLADEAVRRLPPILGRFHADQQLNAGIRLDAWLRFNLRPDLNRSAVFAVLGHDHGDGPRVAVPVAKALHSAYSLGGHVDASGRALGVAAQDISSALPVATHAPGVRRAPGRLVR